MQKRTMLFVVAMIAVLICFAGTAGSAFAQTTTIREATLVKGPNGQTEVQFDGTLPKGVQAGQFTLQPDGTVKAQYFATKAEFNAALGYPNETAQSTQSSAVAGSLLGVPSLVQPASSGMNSKYLVSRYIYNGVPYTRLDTQLWWDYNGSTITAEGGSSVSTSTSPWVKNGNWMDYGQAYGYGGYEQIGNQRFLKNGTTYTANLRNQIQAYGNGSYGDSGTIGSMDSHLTGYTYQVWWDY